MTAQRQVAKASPQAGAVQVSPASGLEFSPGWKLLAGWLAKDSPSSDLLASLPALRRELEEACAPASKRSLAVAIANLIEYCVVFGVNVVDTELTAKLYAESLGDLPADLLDKAVSQCKRYHKFNVLPRPGDVREYVRAEFSRRRDAKQRAEYCQRIAEREGLPVGLLARSGAATEAPRVLAPETEELMLALRKRARGGFREAYGQDWRASAPAEVKPRPDLVERWARELKG